MAMHISTLISSTSTSTLAIVVLGSLLASVIAYFVHNSKKAGLDHIPGPFLARYTDAWRGFHSYNSNRNTATDTYPLRVNREYGDVVRIGPTTVLVQDPEAISLILGFKERLQKGPGYGSLIQAGAKQSALVAIPDEETHGKYRRPIAHAYSLSSLKGYESYIDDEIRRLTDVLEARAKDGKVINMSKWLHYWSYDVVSKISFGKPIGFLDHGSDFNGMITDQTKAFDYGDFVHNMPALDAWLKRNPLLRWFKVYKPSVFVLFARQAVKERGQLLEEDPEANKKIDGNYPDMLGSFFAARPRYSDVLTDERITMYCMANILAGANGSAFSMDGTILFFAQHPEAWERLREDVSNARLQDIDTDNSEGPAALDFAVKIPYMEAVISESIRLVSMESANLERVVSPAGMTLPNGMTLPPGTSVGINRAAMLRRSDVFGANPYDFNPVRWLKREDETEEQFKARRARMDHAMIAFGAGSRACIGKNVVTLELYKLWATLVRLFTFEAVGEIKRGNVWVKVHQRSQDAVKA